MTIILRGQSVRDQPEEHSHGHQQLVNHVCFSPNGQWIASASFDNSLRIWDGVTGKYITTLRGHVGPVYQIRLGRFLKSIGSPFYVSTCSG